RGPVLGEPPHLRPNPSPGASILVLAVAAASANFAWLPPSGPANIRPMIRAVSLPASPVRLAIRGEGKGYCQARTLRSLQVFDSVPCRLVGPVSFDPMARREFLPHDSRRASARVSEYPHPADLHRSRLSP